MISRHIIWRARATALAIACAIASLAAAPPASAAPFDGDWSVLVQTPDHCGTSRWPFAIVGGRIYLPVAVYVGGFPAGLGGRVSPAGQLSVKVVAGPRVATGTGRLGKQQGSGSWAGRGPSGTCAGTWTATRINTMSTAVVVRPQ